MAANWDRETLDALMDVLGTSHCDDRLVALVAERSRSLVGDAEATIVLTDQMGRGPPYVAAATNPRVRRFETAGLAMGECPCIDAVRIGNTDPTPQTHPVSDWPRFSRLAAADGFSTVVITPMTHHNVPIGALAVYSPNALGLTDEGLRLMSLFASLVAARLAISRDLARSNSRVDALEHALQSRIIIEQAKGIVSDRLGVSVAVAFELIRGRSRATNTPVRSLSEAIVARRFDPRRLARATSHSSTSMTR